jgi:hypothetical protein
VARAIQCDICGGFDGESRGQLMLDKLETAFPSFGGKLTVEVRVLEAATMDICTDCRNKILQEIQRLFLLQEQYKPKGK